MNRWDPLWLLLSMSSAAGVNELTKVHFEYAHDAGAGMAVTGTLVLEQDTTPHKLDLATVLVAAGPAVRIWGAPVTVRELWLFSAEADAQTEPDLELFFDFGGAEPPVAADARSVDVLLGRDLPVLPTALGSDLQSRLRLPAATTPWPVVGGTLFIKNAIAVAASEDGSSWRIEGELKLVVLGDSGEQRVNGTFHALLLWR